MEEKPKQKCEKCGEYHYCHKHHPLPKKLFGEGETLYLCPNCHDEYHHFLGHKYLREANKQPMEFYLEKWLHWFYLMVFLGVVLYLAS